MKQSEGVSNRKQWMILLLFVLSFVSCVDPEKKSRSNAEGFFVIWFETLFRSSGYDSACDKPNSTSYPTTKCSTITFEALP
ncbi:hypothetical protein EHQ16_03340 [Leptospira kanakyensis]|uniref:Lipoprotein n=1 Tax=Leptospira kanakyensis TaxID=2484968 RepID=A0A6N4Q7Z5_9LEPT|nr:hypothetical protein EHQ11_16290 [Leptospira kanakyensis]TGK63501.1 hypothetical protein EHQ16_03340 [Leptospira kanakyensis]TGK67105.1 hypothetical protein EHQ18_18580 [Leptospira kanakyensis]